MERLRRLRGDLESWLGTLSSRERVLVTVAALSVAIVAL